MENIFEPKISIVIPTYNSGKFIEVCLNSIVFQSYKNFEILIIDGISKDNTIDIVKSFSEKYVSIKWISEKDKGIYDAMNKGIDLATGEWIFFMGSDDSFHNNNVLYDISKQLKNNHVVYGNSRWTGTGEIYSGEFDSLKLMDRNICHQAIFYKKEIFTILGKYNIKYISMADWAFNMLWFTDKRIKKYYTNLIISEYNQEGFSVNSFDKEFSTDKKKFHRLFPFYLRILFNNRDKFLIGRIYKMLYK